jgi:hypothetical protein
VQSKNGSADVARDSEEDEGEMTIRRAPTCIVCLDPVVVTRGSMCTKCCEAYDRARRRDYTTLGIIRWAAGRARRAVRASRTKWLRG